MINERITLDELRAEVERLDTTSCPEGALTIKDIAASLGFGDNRAREFVRRSLEAGLMRVIMVRKINMVGYPRTVPMYQPVVKPQTKPSRAKKK